MKVFAYSKTGVLYLAVNKTTLISVELKYNTASIKEQLKGVYSCESIEEATSLLNLVSEHASS
jgi:hypothetical protein